MLKTKAEKTTKPDQPTIREGDLTTPTVPWNQIWIPPNRFRTPEKKDVEKLAQDIREDGLISPIAIRPTREYDKTDGYKGQPYTLVAGMHRLTSLMLLGWEGIPIHLREDMTELKARTLELHENLHRKPMTWQEEVEAKEEIFRLRQLENPEITQQEVAAEIGISTASLSKDLATAKALKQTPSLRGAGSKHSALRASKVIEHQEFKEKSKENREKISKELMQRVVTAEMEDWLAGLDGSVADLTIPDLPYGIDYWKSGHKMTAKPGENLGLSEYDDKLIPTMALYQDVVPKLVRATRETGWIICFTGKELFPVLEGLFSNCCAVHSQYRIMKKGESTPRCPGWESESKCRFLVPETPEWFWLRPNSRNNPRYQEFHAKNLIERMVVVNMGKGVLYGDLPMPNVFIHDQEYFGERTHANEKPLALYQDLIQRTTEEGDVVVDPCFGSGKSLAAATSLGRPFLGCDKNPNMIEVARGNVAQHYAPVSRVIQEKSEKRKMMREASDINEGIYDFAEEEDGNS